MKWLPMATAALGVLLLASCSKEAPKALPDPLVEVYQVESDASAPRSGGQAYGLAQSAESVVLAQSSGLVEAVLVKSGERVVAGQALVRLDPVDARLADSSARVQIAAAAAQLASAEADFARYERLRQQNFISQAEFERRQAAVLAARAEHEARLDGLGLLTCRALSPGVVQRIGVARGQRVQAGAVLMVIAGASPAASQAAMAVGQSPRQSIRVPLSALINGGQAVMLVEAAEGGHRVRQQAVVVTTSDERWAQLAQGLRVGDRVVAIGAHLLTDGQRVRLPAAVPAAPAAQ
ncbi:MAG: efflux RND transporter periplasmic adaptor subunit [Burkholderiaceae bacterium]